MKEQTQYNITPEQGWAKMKPVLDEAMPQSKPVRRFPFYWWAASAVIVAGVLGIAFLNGGLTTAAVEKQDARSAQNDFRTDQYNSGDAMPETGSEGHAEPIIESDKITHTGLGLASENSPASQNESNVQKAVSSELKNTKPIPASAQNAPIQDTRMNISEVQGIYLAEGQSTQQDLVAEKMNDGVSSEMNFIHSEIQVTSSRNASVIQPLFTLPIPLVSEKEARSDVTFSNAAKKAKRNPVWCSPTVIASSLFGQHGGLGWYGGVGLDVNLSRKFSVSTAIGYTAYRPDANILGSSKSEYSFSELNPILNSDPASGFDNYVYSEDINVEADYNAINPLVETISQWQVDLGVNWRFSKRFYATGGVKFGFHTEAFSQFPIVLSDPTGIPTYPQVELSNSLSDYDVIRKSNTSMFLGLGYRMGKHFDVFANWTHGFDQYVLNAESVYTADLSPGGRTDYIRGVSLGLKYSL